MPFIILPRHPFHLLFLEYQPLGPGQLGQNIAGTSSQILMERAKTMTWDSTTGISHFPKVCVMPLCFWYSNGIFREVKTLVGFLSVYKTGTDVSSSRM